MNQEKMGLFLKALRKEKDFTQAELAEIISVSNRTVSRWETGANAPDLAILVELADFYQIEVVELIVGERKEIPMVVEKTEISQVVAYSQDEQVRRIRVFRLLFAVAILSVLVAVMMEDFVSLSPRMIELISEFLLGVSVGSLTAGLILTTRVGKKLETYKRQLLKR